ncbi:hypothetical protein JOF34_000800 [Microbacterium amylolyticum]|uniref:Integrase catalytic domain-containing protein n=1 Tax=Microbacterium amylolyticum TaxID=936337 RepID=A0ABS4ZG04_9MICO|nr:hypothetical protein [Microbacterium amylolyticum]
MNGYYKTELVRGPARPGPWKTVEDLELATLGWVNWHNTQRLHGYLSDVPPAEFEQTFYAGKPPPINWWESTSASLHQTQGASTTQRRDMTTNARAQVTGPHDHDARPARTAPDRRHGRAVQR